MGRIINGKINNKFEFIDAIRKELSGKLNVSKEACEEKNLVYHGSGRAW